MGALTGTVLGLIGPIGTTELIILGLIGLLIFGRKLPEVGRSLGKGIVEFKRGLSGIEDSVEEASREPEKLEGRPGGQSHETGGEQQTKASPPGSAEGADASRSA